MTILALDTSGPTAGVALLVDGVLRYEATTRNKLTHSVNLMPMVEEALAHSDCTLPQVDLFAAVVGPGSFTGVRIGVAAVQGMAQALDKPCLAVNALEALAQGMWAEDIIVCPIRDARVNQVYGAAFRGGARLMEDVALKLPLYLERIGALGDRFLFVGDGAEAYREQLVADLGDRACFAPIHLNALKAGAAAMLALRDQAQAVPPDQLLPLYLRQPQAVREREQRHG